MTRFGTTRYEAYQTEISEGVPLPISPPHLSPRLVWLCWLGKVELENELTRHSSMNKNAIGRAMFDILPQLRTREWLHSYTFSIAHV